MSFWSYCYYCGTETPTKEGDCDACGLSKTSENLEVKPPDNPSDKPQRPSKEKDRQERGPHKE